MNNVQYRSVEYKFQSNISLNKVRLGRCDENDSFTDLTIYSSNGLNSDTVDVSLFVIDLIEEFFLKRLSW